MLVPHGGFEDGFLTLKKNRPPVLPDYKSCQKGKRSEKLYVEAVLIEVLRAGPT